MILEGLNMFRCGRENQCIDYILWSADSSAHGSLLDKQFVRTSNSPDLGKPDMLKSRLNGRNNGT